MRNGVQYATVTTKKCPMFDDVCAARVIQQIADRLTRGDSAHGFEAEIRVNETTIGQLQYALAVIERTEPGDQREQGLANIAAEIARLEGVIAAWRVKADAARAAEPSPEARATALVEEKCGRFTRGAHKGQLRGWASIEVCTVGGWKKNGPGEGNGHVVRPGSILAISIGDDFSGKTYLEVR